MIRSEAKLCEGKGTANRALKELEGPDDELGGQASLEWILESNFTRSKALKARNLTKNDTGQVREERCRNL
jgi:hypothetical protein